MTQDSRHDEMQIESVPLPVAPKTIEETGLSRKFLIDLFLKNLFSRDQASGIELAQITCLPSQIAVELMSDAKTQMLCEVTGSTTTYAAHFTYRLTERGRQRVRDVLESSPYEGPAPIPLDAYCGMVQQQSLIKRNVTLGMIHKAFEGLVIGEDLLRRLGAAYNSGSSLFLYGYPGNGKTVMAERLSRISSMPILIPYAIEADSQVIKLYNANAHHRVTGEETGLTSEALKRADQRWVLVQRPFVMAGGELRLEDLDIHFDQNTKQHLAPLQMLANGGVFLIDDFGRQQVPPATILNRWMVPLEQGIDYYTLATGKQITVPFDPLLVLSTNLSPAELVDEAFLRRIRYKIEIPPPTEEQFRDIFHINSQQYGVLCDDDVLDYLLNYHYFEMRREFRSCHPRDLLTQCVALASFEGAELKLTRHLIDEACKTYFIEL